jgi:hypothetical protein
MKIRLSDQEIARLVSEPKPLPKNFKSLMQLRTKKGHRERDLDVMGSNGNDFRIIQRQSESNILDFSVILAYRPRQTNDLFLLRRYNGRSHEHTNSIEEQTFYAFHIHQATERYQDLGAKEASYAEPTNIYASIEQAFECMLAECRFVIPPEIPTAQRKMF